MLAYVTALREFAWRIPDGHVSGPPPGMEFQEAIGGGLGLGIRDVDDGRVIVNFLTPGGPAEEAGIELGAEIIALDGVPIDEAVDAAVAWSAPFSTEHVERLQKLRYAVRFPLGTEVEVTWANPGGDEQTETIETSDEAMSFNASSFRGASSMLDLPVQYEFIPGTDYVRVSITSFADNSLLAIQLWERMITTLNQQQIPGLVIDMRNNLGGAGFLADQMAAYFFQEPLELGQTARYDESLDEFKIDERNTDVYYLPDESLRFDGPVAVLIGPNCNSACEFFAYDMTLQDRAAIIGQYATAGLGGGVTDALMPLGIFFRMTVARALDMDGEIHIEGKGVQPTVQVPVTEETLFSDGDPILEAAVEWLDEQ
jgi:C-terminal processing protease CtpA/Prc